MPRGPAGTRAFGSIAWAFAQAFGQRHFLDGIADQLLDAREFAHVTWSDEGDRLALPCGTRGPSNAMDIILRIAWHVVVHHDVDVVDVDAAAHHVGGHEDAQFAVAEGEHHLLAFILLQVAVHGLGIEAALLEVPRQVPHLHLLAARTRGCWWPHCCAANAPALPPSACRVPRRPAGRPPPPVCSARW